jgi:hypothetical protein
MFKKTINVSSVINRTEFVYKTKIYLLLKNVKKINVTENCVTFVGRYITLTRHSSLIFSGRISISEDGRTVTYCVFFWNILIYPLFLCLAMFISNQRSIWPYIFLCFVFLLAIINRLIKFNEKVFELIKLTKK